MEVLPVVVEEMHLVAVEPDAAFLVSQEGVVLPGIPQAGDDFVEFDRAFVAGGVVHMGVEVEVAGLVLDLAGHQVPAATAVADVVDRRETAGDVVGLVEGRGGGGHQADMRRAHRECGEARRGFQLHDARQARACQVAGLQRIRPADRDGVLEEDGVIQRALGHLREAHVPAEIHVGFNGGIGVAPARQVVARHG